MKEVLLIKRLKNGLDSRECSYDPTCFDHNIHIRLKTYKGDELIAGFEQKLIFVIEYFLHRFIRSFTTYTIDFKKLDDNSEATKKYIFLKYINEFKQSPAYLMIKKDLKNYIDFDDIVIKGTYSKKEISTKESQFGNIFDIIDENFITNNHDSTVDVNIFLNKFDVSYSNFANLLLDDSISLLFSEVEDNLNEKYLNKNARKLAKDIASNGGFEESKLW